MVKNVGKAVGKRTRGVGKGWGTLAIPSDCRLGWYTYKEWECVRYRNDECGRLVKYKKFIITNGDVRPSGDCRLIRGPIPLHKYPQFICPRSKGPFGRSSEGPTMGPQ